MRVLVAIASRTRGTRFVAEALGDHLSSRGLDADVRDVAELTGINDYDAVIVGAALGRRGWRRDARQFVISHAGSLSDRPAWLYAARRSRRRDVAGSGDVDLSKIVKAIGVHEHRVFDVPSDRSLRRLQKRRGGPDKLGSRNVWWQASDWASAIINEMQMRRTLMSAAGRGGYLAAPAERPRSTSGRR